MSKTIRIALFLVLMSGLLILAGQNNAWASPPPPIDVTVQAPKEEEPYELGGCVTGLAKAFKPEIQLNVAVLEAWDSYPLEGLPPMPDYYWDLPGAPADVFSCVVILRIKENGNMVKTFPAGKGTADICLETPPDKAGWIYYFDEFKLFSQNPSWEEVGGKFPGGSVACVPVTRSGVYAFYAPIPEAHPEEPGSGETIDITIPKGSVQVPATVSVSLTQPGALQLAGCVTGNFKDVPENNKVNVKLIDKWNPDLPTKIGEFYRCVVEVKFFDGSNLIETLAVDKGNALICFAVPPFKNGSIYYLNSFFGKDAEWEKIAGPFPTGIACGPVDRSGLYGMVDVQAK